MIIYVCSEDDISWSQRPSTITILYMIIGCYHHCTDQCILMRSEHSYSWVIEPSATVGHGHQCDFYWTQADTKCYLNQTSQFLNCEIITLTPPAHCCTEIKWNKIWSPHITIRVKNRVKIKINFSSEYEEFVVQGQLNEFISSKSDFVEKWNANCETYWQRVLPVIMKLDSQNFLLPAAN